MRKVVIWTGAAAGIASAAVGWVVQAALSKAAAFVYAIVVSVVANLVFDYVKTPPPVAHELTPEGGAVATAVIKVKPRRIDAGAPKFSLPVSMPATLPPPDTGVAEAAPPAGSPPAPDAASGAMPPPSETPLGIPGSTAAPAEASAPGRPPVVRPGPGCPAGPSAF